MTLNASMALPSWVHPSLCGMIEPKSPTAKIASRQVVNLALARRAFVFQLCRATQHAYETVFPRGQVFAMVWILYQVSSYR
jgi:hypothetical protein